VLPPPNAPIGRAIELAQVIGTPKTISFASAGRACRAATPPISVQNLVPLPLRALAMAFGLHPHRNRWESREAPGSETTA